MSEDLLWVEFEDKILLDNINELQQAKDKLQSDYQEARDRIEELQQRIQEAIEFIEAWEKEKTSLEVSMLDLLYIKEILGDKENE